MSNLQSPHLEPDHRPYHARGAAKALWESNDREVLICGPVGTGKTRGGLEKVHAVCENFPGARVLLLRQTRHSLSETAMVTFEDHVLPPGHPVLRDGRLRTSRPNYHYPNKSEIILGGLDDPIKFMSGEYDMIYIVEATEVMESAVDDLTTRLRNFKVPFQQLMMDCNPNVPNHWLKQRCDRGTTRLLQSWLQDNPRFHDGNDWTKQGSAYLETLGALTGHKRRRLVEGIWAAPQGARFEGASRFEMGFDLYKEFPNGFPETWTRWLSADYGKADPYCCLWHVVDLDGIIWTYMEDYERGFEADQQADRIIAASPQNDLAYQSIHMDKSMWSKEKTFGGHPQKGPAADQYQAAFSEYNKKNKVSRFGPPIKGAPNINEEAYITLDSKLRDGTWRISTACTNLWREIEDAVHYQDPRTKTWFEQINPHPTKKYCDDHALEAAGYGIHKRKPITPQERKELIEWGAIAEARQKEIRKESERRYGKKDRPRHL